MANKYFSSNIAGGSYQEHRTLRATVKRGVQLGYYGILDSYKEKLSGDEIDEIEIEMDEVAEEIRFRRNSI